MSLSEERNTNAIETIEMLIDRATSAEKPELIALYLEILIRVKKAIREQGRVYLETPTQDSHANIVTATEEFRCSWFKLERDRAAIKLKVAEQNQVEQEDFKQFMFLRRECIRGEAAAYAAMQSYYEEKSRAL